MILSYNLHNPHQYLYRVALHLLRMHVLLEAAPPISRQRELNQVADSVWRLCCLHMIFALNQATVDPNLVGLGAAHLRLPPASFTL